MSPSSLEAKNGIETSHLEKPVTVIDGIGPKKAQLLAQLGIVVVHDLIRHTPRTYVDRRQLTPIAEVAEGDTVTIQAAATQSRTIRMRGRNSMAEVTFRDSTGEIKATWFGRGFLAKTFSEGTRAILTGVAGKYSGLALKNPEYEILTDNEDDLLNTGRIVPVYALTEGISQRMMRRWVRASLDDAKKPVGETLSAHIRARHGFPAIAAALTDAHFPTNMEDAERARRRFAYEEFLAIQNHVLRSRHARRTKHRGRAHCVDGPLVEALRARLPYRLTSAQERVVNIIFRDMASPAPMGMLLQGDVGCGKTVVAVHAVAAAIDSDAQAALMAPTEILAEQHFLSLESMLKPLGVRIDLLTGSTPGAAAIRARIKSGETQVVVGTHALFQTSTEFHALGLTLIDEQHRFGVMQRHRLARKGEYPEVLHMTATPIPRTLTMTLYGAMDIALIDEMPPGRTPVKTRRIPRKKESDLYDYVIEQARQGLQSFFVCPLIEDSETKSLSAATTRFEELRNGPFHELRTELLHGKMPPDEKESTMTRFYSGEIDVLFSTTVIEVGIDVPTATTMIIDDAAQFGLTQLHQLRGRVGRSSRESFCFLLGNAKTDEGDRRLEIMCGTNDGFAIAEADLELRGAGQFYGLRQSGLTDLRVADLIRDIDLLEAARQDARESLEA